MLTQLSFPMCAWDGCDKPAVYIAYDREKGALGYYCRAHATIVAKHGFPEYVAACPNCGCRFSVN